MNQIPNIEETNTREVENVIEHFNNQFTDHDDGTFTVGLDTRYATKEDFTEFIRANLHQELQKARHDWLRKEIVRLEEMKESTRDCGRCNNCESAVSQCESIIYYNGLNTAIQTIIDRYHSELDQDKE